MCFFFECVPATNSSVISFLFFFKDKDRDYYTLLKPNKNPKTPSKCKVNRSLDKQTNKQTKKKQSKHNSNGHGVTKSNTNILQPPTEHMRHFILFYSMLVVNIKNIQQYIQQLLQVPTDHLMLLLIL